MGHILNHHVSLRTLKTSDLDWLLSVENNPKYWGVSGTNSNFSKSQIQNYITHATTPIDEAKQFRFVIVHQKKPVGLIDLFDFDERQQKAGIGIVVEEQYQSKGLGASALKLLIQYATAELKLKLLFANITPTNTKSIQLFKNQNFHLVETKKDWIFANQTTHEILHFQYSIND